MTIKQSLGTYKTKIKAEIELKYDIIKPQLKEQYRKIYREKLQKQLDKGEYNEWIDKINSTMTRILHEQGMINDFKISNPCTYDEASYLETFCPYFSIGFYLTLPGEYKRYKKDKLKWGKRLQDVRPDLYDTYLKHYT